MLESRLLNSVLPRVIVLFSSLLVSAYVICWFLMHFLLFILHFVSFMCISFMSVFLCFYVLFAVCQWSLVDWFSNKWNGMESGTRFLLTSEILTSFTVIIFKTPYEDDTFLLSSYIIHTRNLVFRIFLPWFFLVLYFPFSLFLPLYFLCSIFQSRIFRPAFLARLCHNFQSCKFQSCIFSVPTWVPALLPSQGR